MRVVHVNTEATWRGGENQVLNLMRGLKRLGHDVECVALPGSILAQRCRQESIPALELAMRSDGDVFAAVRLARHLRRNPCEILHAQTARAHSIALLARIAGAKARVVVSRRLDFPIRRSPWNLWKYRNRRVDSYIAVAAVIRDILIDAGVSPSKVTVINSSIDLARFTGVGDHRAELRRAMAIPMEALVVGNVAALAWHKGQKDLLAAMPAVLASVPEVRLVIVGGGEEREALERQARELGLGARVTFTGVRNDIPQILTMFDVFCISSYLEGLCNSVLEAFAMKLPVVATRAGGLPEIVADERTGLLAPARDPEGLAAALVRMLTDRPLATRVAEAGHRLVHERFGVEHMVARTEALYREVVGRQG